MKNRLKELLDTFHANMVGKESKETLSGDTALLCEHIFRLREMVLNVNKNVLKCDPRAGGHEDLCPVCASHCWARPFREDQGHDFTQRECHNCYHVRPEPEEVTA